MKIEKEGNDMRMKSKIERGGRIVWDKKIGIVGEGNRNNEKMENEEGKIMRILFEKMVGLRDRKKLKKLKRERKRMFEDKEIMVEMKRLDDMIEDFNKRVKRWKRVMKDNRNNGKKKIENIKEG